VDDALRRSQNGRQTVMHTNLIHIILAVFLTIFPVVIPDNSISISYSASRSFIS